MRPHIAAVYAFARIADDIADEGSSVPDVRRARLRAWQKRLHEAVRVNGPLPAAPSQDDLVIRALAHTVRTLDLPVSLLDDLISAFAQDISVSRYDSWTGVFDYCRRSANPVGRLVLRIAGYSGEALERSSDALCTALQLTNFWQDFGRDWRAGRLYVPRDVMSACGASEADLASGTLTPEWVRALESSIEVTRARFDEGRAVCDGVKGRLHWELRLTWLGGRRILDRVHRDRGTLLYHRPTLGARDLPALAWQATRWKGVAA